ncbi:hypothetical protein ACFL1T_03825 [Chlamydiota bacterium]
MIKNKKLWNEFERKFIAENKLSYKKAIKIYEAMWQEAVSLGVLPSKNPLEGIEKNIRIARIINKC